MDLSVLGSLHTSGVTRVEMIFRVRQKKEEQRKRRKKMSSRKLQLLITFHV